MKNLISKSLFRSFAIRILAWGALAGCLAASPLMAQYAIGGNFTLNENARFGNTLLAAGPYTFSIEPIGTIQSIRSIQQGAGHLVLVVMKPEKSGPVTSVFAMASATSHLRQGSELILDSAKAGTLVERMYLEKEGLTVDFRWFSPKAEGQVVAQQALPVQTAAVRSEGK
ncbi:MAG TPA: hypothetical protein VKQ28_10630 [Candidatus Acidoferrum sp.]|nr:hypothetical protein [Candidatus Acidoferrum sp.]